MVRELSVLQKKLSNYKSIAIITARGGSKRIPKKKYKKNFVVNQLLHIQLRLQLTVKYLMK